MKTAFFDPEEPASRSHLQAKDKVSGQGVSCHYLLSLNMQHHPVHLRGPPHESVQLAVSIRPQSRSSTGRCGLRSVPLGRKHAQTADDHLSLSWRSRGGQSGDSFAAGPFS
jgi:hypothetical protein